MNDYYNTVLATYLALQAGIMSFHKPIDGMTDAFNTTTGIDVPASSSYWHEVARSGFGPLRSQSESILTENFDSYSTWTNSSAGTGTRSIVNIVDPVDPAINGNVLHLDTGSTLGSIARVQKDIGSIPSTFGVGLMTRIGTTSIYGSDSLHIDITNIDNAQLRIRERYMAYEVFQDGAWQLVLAHPNHTAFMESWVEVMPAASGMHRVQVLLGTEIIFDRTGYLPGGTGIDGQVVVWQEGTASNYRWSEVGYIHLGSTQKPDNMTITSQTVNAMSVPTIAKLLLLVEDVSNSVAINFNVVGEVSNDGGATWQAVALARRGTFAPGEIDPPKNTDIFTGELTLTGTGSSMKWRFKTTDNQWSFLQGVHLGWE